MRMQAKIIWCGLAMLVTQVFAQQENNVDLLSATVAHAVTFHPMVVSALKSKDASSSGYSAAKWQYYPSPSISTERGNSLSHSNYENTTTTTLRVQQDIWTGGRVSANVNDAFDRVRLSEVGVLEAKTSVAERALDAWYALLLNFGRSQASQRMLERLQSLAEMIDRRVERDISANVDKVLIRARVTQLNSDLLAQRTSQAVAEERLGQLVGDSTLMARLNEQNLSNQMRGANDDLPNTLLSDILLALDRHVQIQRNSVENSLARDELQRKQADILPSVYFRIDRQIVDTDTTYFKTKVADTKVYLGMQYSPGAGLAAFSSIREAQGRVLASQLAREGIRRDLQDLANSRWREYVDSGLRLRQTEETMKAATDVLDAYMRLFVVGKRTWLDVLNAARELQAIEWGISDLQAQRVVSAYRLKMLKGTFDWQSSQEFSEPALLQ